jgi:hypothetical protein
MTMAASMLLIIVIVGPLSYAYNSHFGLFRPNWGHVWSPVGLWRQSSPGPGDVPGRQVSGHASVGLHRRDGLEPRTRAGCRYTPLVSPEYDHRDAVRRHHLLCVCPHGDTVACHGDSGPPLGTPAGHIRPARPLVMCGISVSADAPAQARTPPRHVCMATGLSRVRGGIPLTALLVNGLHAYLVGCLRPRGS